MAATQPAPPAPPAAQLAQRLRQLREEHWPDAPLTQATLAKVFNVEERLASATVSSWESLTSPKLPPPPRLRAYARFFSTPRSVEAGPKLLALEELTQDEITAYRELEAELLGLRSAASGKTPDKEVVSSKSWKFSDTGPLTFICAQLPSKQIGPLGNTENPNYTELQTFADLDALMELHGYIRAENPTMDVHIKPAPRVVPDDLSGHVVVIGGIAWNEITARLSNLARLPIRQVADPKLETGEIFVTEIDSKEHKFWPKWLDQDEKILDEDVGLLARVPNPLNSSRTLTICNGIHSRGVYGAVRSLTDARLRDSNEHYISVNFGSSGPFAILMSVKIIENQAMTPDFAGPDSVLYRWPQKDHQITPAGQISPLAKG